MIKLIEIPYGEFPSRTVSGVDYGTRIFNEVSVSVQLGVLEEMEMTDIALDKMTTVTAG